MASYKFDFPLFVQPQQGGGYKLRGLFDPNIEAFAPRYDTALRKYRNLIREFLRGQQGLKSLGRYFYNPEIHFAHIKLHLRVGMSNYSGDVAYAHCDVRGNRYVCLPNLDNFMFIAEPVRTGKYNIPQQIEVVLENYIRQAKKDSEEIQQEHIFSHTREFITQFEMLAEVPDARFPFEELIDDGFFDALFSFDDFNGAQEIHKVAKDINDLFPDALQPYLFNEQRVHRLVQTLYGKRPVAVALLGENGVGRTSLVHQCVNHFLQTGSRGVQREKIWHLDPVRVISGMSIVGQWQRRMESIVDFLIERSQRYRRPPDKLFIDNLIGFMHIGKSAQNDLTLADLIKPYLEERQLVLIVEATSQQWEKAQEINRSFTDLFQVIRLQEPNFDQVLPMANHHRQRVEAQHKCRFTTEAFVALVKRHGEKQSSIARPGSIVRVLERLAVKFKNSLITPAMVERDYQAVSQLRSQIMDDERTLDPKQLRQHFSHLIIGQEQAVEALLEAVMLLKSGLYEPGKPARSFLFIGPTGVGKTLAAKCLANFLYDSPAALIRFDMNEYIDSSAVIRLIGSSDWQGQREGQLTSKVRYQPFSILLLDEIEKAHATVHDLLLQLLGEGRLTDAMGRTTDFSRCIVIMTSNLGATDAASKMGFLEQQDEVGSSYKKAVTQFFRPEFVNRIDSTVVFKSLSREHIMRVARLELKNLLQREGFLRRTTILSVSDEALDSVANKGFDSALGGRALKRRLESDLIAVSAKQLVTSQADTPVIFRLQLKDGKLTPKISNLNFAKALAEAHLPLAPPSKLRLVFYRKLLHRIEVAIEALNEKRDDTSVKSEGIEIMQQLEHWFAFKDQISECVWQLEALYDSPRQPIGAKALHLDEDLGQNQAELRLARLNLAPIQKSNELYDQLKNAYQRCEVLVESKTTEYVLQSARLSLMEYFDSRMQEGEATTNINISCAVKGEQYNPLVQFLFELYQGFLSQFDLEIESALCDELTQDAQIVCRGPGLLTLLQQETGIHLFYAPQGIIVPIEMTIGQQDEAGQDLEIIRVYQLGAEPGNSMNNKETESSPTLLDLRYSWLMRGQGNYFLPWILINHIRTEFDFAPLWLDEGQT